MTTPPRIKEIIERTSNEFHESELIEVLEYYILKRKNRSVKISLSNFNYFIQIHLLSEAFDSAREWLLNNQE